MKILSLLATCLVSVLSGCNPSSNVLNNAQIKERLPHKASVVWNPTIQFSIRETVDYTFFNDLLDSMYTNNYPYGGDFSFTYKRSYDFTRIKGYEIGVDSYTRVDTLLMGIDTDMIDPDISPYDPYQLVLSDFLTNNNDDVDIYQYYVGTIHIGRAQNLSAFNFNINFEVYHYFNVRTCEGLYFSSSSFNTNFDFIHIDSIGSRYWRTASAGDKTYVGASLSYPEGRWQIPNYFVNANGTSLIEKNFVYCPNYSIFENVYTNINESWSNLKNIVGLQCMFTLYDNTYNDAHAGDSYNNGYDNGKNAGFEEGYQTGHDVGYQEGLQVNNPYTFGALFGAIADTPVLIFRSLFNFDLFGTSALVVVMSLFTALVLIFIAKKLLR